MMPLSTDPAHVFNKMKLDARRIHAAIDGFEYKAVYKAVHARQDQQKYARQNVRAEMFVLQPGQSKTLDSADVETRILIFCKKMKWDTKDVKKVYWI